MKHRISTLLGLVTIPFLLIIFCSAIVLTVGAMGWLLWGEEGGSRLIRVIPLPPLTTPQADGSQPAPGDAQAPANGPGVAPVVPPESQAEGVEGEPPPVSEPSQSASGFPLPPGSVNSITQDGVATRLVIPKLSLDAPIILSPLEGQSWKVDHLGTDYVGHLEGTARPGSNSNIVLAAHVTVAAGVYGPFASLGDLTVGDEVYVYYGEERFKYIIADYQVVDRTAVEVTHPSEQGEVTLITCTTWSSVEGRYLERVVLKGYLAEG